MADLLLTQGKEPDGALALTEERITAQADPRLQPGRLAMKARALAALGRLPEMDEAIAAALRDLDANVKAVAASAHLEIGKALLTAQRIPEAIEHFRTANRTHPDGHVGALVRRELEKLGAPSA
jgi:tetratricopeptide (TPR) repeat protein